MSGFTPLVIVFLAMLIQIFLQAMPGVFMIFYHSALAKYSAKKTDDLSLGVILGTEIFTAITLISLYLVFLLTFLNQPDFQIGLFPWLMAGVCFSLFVTSLLFYFRRTSGTRLYLPRKITQGLRLRAEKVKTRSDAILLGIVAAGAEIIFSLPLFIIITTTTMEFSVGVRCSIFIGDIIITVIPAFIIRAFYRLHHNIAEIQRFREKKRLFFGLVICLGYLGLAMLMIYTGILNNG